MILYYHPLQEPEQKSIESTFLRRKHFFWGDAFLSGQVESPINQGVRRIQKKPGGVFFPIIGEAFKDLGVIVFFGILNHSGFRNMLFCNGILTIGATKAFKQDPTVPNLSRILITRT